jgi:hypothetical protein
MRLTQIHCRFSHEQGKVERDAVYQPMLDALAVHYKDVPKDERAALTVLTPGAGLARLSWEICQEGTRLPLPTLYPLKLDPFLQFCCQLRSARLRQTGAASFLPSLQATPPKAPNSATTCSSAPFSCSTEPRPRSRTPSTPSFTPSPITRQTPR